jgi:hypothetical protein
MCRDFVFVFKKKFFRPASDSQDLKYNETFEIAIVASSCVPVCLRTVVTRNTNIFFISFFPFYICIHSLSLFLIYVVHLSCFFLYLVSYLILFLSLSCFSLYLVSFYLYLVSFFNSFLSLSCFFLYLVSLFILFRT